MTRFYPSIDIKYGRRSIEKPLERGRIIPENGKVIYYYIEQYRAVRNSKEHRILKTTFDLVNWRRFILNPYGACNVEEICQGINAMTHGGVNRAK